eukprot:1460162-Rhodomonas_salina.1
MWKGVYKCVECESENEAPLGHSNICEICGSAEDPNVIAYRCPECEALNDKPAKQATIKVCEVCGFNEDSAEHKEETPEEELARLKGVACAVASCRAARDGGGSASSARQEQADPAPRLLRCASAARRRMRSSGLRLQSASGRRSSLPRAARLGGADGVRGAQRGAGDQAQRRAAERGGEQGDRGQGAGGPACDGERARDAGEEHRRPPERSRARRQGRQGVPGASSKGKREGGGGMGRVMEGGRRRLDVEG